MFNKRGWVQDKEPTLVVFSGGSDVTPELYGDKKHPTTKNIYERDRNEVWSYHVHYNRSKVGICRGGQFLNVMNGGRMYQDVNNHGVSHMVHDINWPDQPIFCTSTHHQMMIPAPEGGKVIAVANEATRFADGNGQLAEEFIEFGRDKEVIWYGRTHSLCFQPHPEYEVKSCEDYFFRLIELFFGIKG